LVNAPKPKEISYGCRDPIVLPRAVTTFKDGVQIRTAATTKRAKAQHVLDLLTGHPQLEVKIKPQIPAGTKAVRCLDAIKCRRYALCKRSRGLPIFSPLDEWEPFDSRPCSDWDFVYIDMGDVRIHRGIAPYTGSRWYIGEVCEDLLDRGVITRSQCKAALRAGTRLSCEKFTEAIEKITQVCSQVSPRESFAKNGILAMIGLWNATSQFAWKKVESTYQIDAGSGLKHRHMCEDGSYEFFTGREIVDLHTMVPWGRIALDTEQLRVSQATRLLESYASQGMSIVGTLVDGVFFVWNSFEPLPDLEWCYRHPDGSRIFKVKEEPIGKVPTHEQSDMTRSQQLTFDTHEWKIIPEQDIANVENGEGVANLFLEHGGMLLSGPAGVGKSFILDYVIQHLELQGKKVLTMAIRHAAAVLIGGKTVSHYLHKFKAKGGAPKRGTIVVIDEWSEVQLHTWSELIKWKIVGVQFILVGDADGQRKPICDQWQKAMDAKDIRESQFIWELCGGLRVKLNKYRRGIDQKLFNDYTSLYEWADLDVYVGDTRN
jgi:hypothetical protein